MYRIKIPLHICGSKIPILRSPKRVYSFQFSEHFFSGIISRIQRSASLPSCHLFVNIAQSCQTLHPTLDDGMMEQGRGGGRGEVGDMTRSEEWLGESYTQRDG